MKDFTRGANVKQAVKRRLKEAGQQLMDKAVGKLKIMIGSGRNKRRKCIQRRRISSQAKKERTQAIFS